MLCSTGTAICRHHTAATAAAPTLVPTTYNCDLQQQITNSSASRTCSTGGGAWLALLHAIHARSHTHASVCHHQTSAQAAPVALAEQLGWLSCVARLQLTSGHHDGGDAQLLEGKHALEGLTLWVEQNQSCSRQSSGEPARREGHSSCLAASMLAASSSTQPPAYAACLQEAAQNAVAGCRKGSTCTSILEVLVHWQAKHCSCKLLPAPQHSASNAY